MICCRQQLFATLPLFTMALVLPACEKLDAESWETRGFTDHAQLSSAAASTNVELQDELARLRAERATPIQLDEDAQLARTELCQKAHDQWCKVFSDETLMLASEELRRALPGPLPRVTTATRPTCEKVDSFYRSQRLELRQIIAWESTPFRVNHRAGLASDTLPFDVAEVYHELEILHAAIAVDENDLPTAIESLGYTLATSRKLAWQSHVVPRMLAVDFRRRALQVAQDVVQHEQINRAMLQQLKTIIDTELQSWSRDSTAWIGDRALGLHVYEMVRAGDMISVLDDAERAELRADGSLYTLATMISNGIDDDQVYYLRTMRRIIDACESSYFQRQALFEEITQYLHTVRAEPEFPFVAGRFLLPAVKNAHRRQAIDRARMEAWAIALATALNQSPPPYQQSPVTGDSYRVVVQAGEVRVDRLADLGDDIKIAVPTVSQ